MIGHLFILHINYSGKIASCSDGPNYTLSIPMKYLIIIFLMEGYVIHAKFKSSKVMSNKKIKASEYFERNHKANGKK